MSYLNKGQRVIRVHRLDSVSLDNTFFTEEGYLRDEPIVTSVGIFEYTNPDGTIRRELRLPEHVFDKESLASYEGKPIIITHDAGYIDKDNVNEEIVGTMLSAGFKDGDDVRVKVVVHEIDTVKQSGIRELSLGYDLELDQTPGEWNGQPYDAIQTDIRINHLALVGEARAGDQARLNLDENKFIPQGGLKMTKPKKTIGATALTRKLNAKYKRRLDEAAEDGENEDVEYNDDCEGQDSEQNDSMFEGEIEKPEVATEPSDTIDFIKNRRDDRAEDGAPETLEEALACILQQDEDIDSLIDIVEELQAKTDFDGSAEDNEDKEGNDDEDNEDNDDEGESGVTLKITTDSVDKIVADRIRMGQLGDQLGLRGLESMKPLAAKKAIIRKVNPKMRLDGKSKSYINAAFDIAVDTMNVRKDIAFQKQQMAKRRADGFSAPTGETSAQAARARMIAKQYGGEE